MTKETIIKAKLYHHGPSLRMRSVTIYAKKLLNSWQYFLLEGEKMQRRPWRRKMVLHSPSQHLLIQDQ